MGSENFIRTGTIIKTPKKINAGAAINMGGGGNSSLLPSSTYQFGIVKVVNPVTKEIVYDAIEDNMSSQKLGKALPLYKNKIQLPTTGSIVPLLRGPNTNVGVITNQYNKIAYYLDPIGVWQTVNDNLVERIIDISPLTSEVNIDKLSIKGIEIGIPYNSPELNKTTVDTAQRPLPSPTPSPLPNSSTPVPSPAAPPPAPPSSNFTFRVRLNYETWIADIYNNGILIGEKTYAFITGDGARGRDREIITELKNEAKYFGFVINNNFYPPQPNIV